VITPILTASGGICEFYRGLGVAVEGPPELRRQSERMYYCPLQKRSCSSTLWPAFHYPPLRNANSETFLIAWNTKPILAPKSCPGQVRYHQPIVSAFLAEAAGLGRGQCVDKKGTRTWPILSCVSLHADRPKSALEFLVARSTPQSTPIQPAIRQYRTIHHRYAFWWIGIAPRPFFADEPSRSDLINLND